MRALRAVSLDRDWGFGIGDSSEQVAARVELLAFSVVRGGVAEFAKG
jgi:hypothetical protein